MKFRAYMDDATIMNDFFNIITSLAKFSKICVMRITEKNVYFIICEEDNGPTRPLIWYELPVNFYFRQYTFEGLSEENNEVYLELLTGQLTRSISIIKQNVKYLKIKLAHREIPCLTFETELLKDENVGRGIIEYDMQADVIPRKNWQDYAEPVFDDFHITLGMPPMKHLRNIVEKMTDMGGQYLTISANRSGRLVFQLKESLVKISSHFLGLPLESFSGNSQEEEDDETCSISSTIDIKKFLMFLNSLQFNNCKMFCGIVNNRMVKLQMVQAGTLKLQIFLPEIDE